MSREWRRYAPESIEVTVLKGLAAIGFGTFAAFLISLTPLPIWVCYVIGGLFVGYSFGRLMAHHGH